MDGWIDGGRVMHREHVCTHTLIDDTVCCFCCSLARTHVDNSCEREALSLQPASQSPAPCDTHHFEFPPYIKRYGKLLGLGFAATQSNLSNIGGRETLYVVQHDTVRYSNRPFFTSYPKVWIFATYYYSINFSPSSRRSESDPASSIPRLGHVVVD